MAKGRAARWAEEATLRMEGRARYTEKWDHVEAVYILVILREIFLPILCVPAEVPSEVSKRATRTKAEQHAPNFISSLKPSHDRFMPCTPASTSVPSVRIGLVEAYWLYPDPPASANESLAADSVNDVVSELIACAGKRSGVLKSIGRGLNAGAGGW